VRLLLQCCFLTVHLCGAASGVCWCVLVFAVTVVAGGHQRRYADVGRGEDGRSCQVLGSAGHTHASTRCAEGGGRRVDAALLGAVISTMLHHCSFSAPFQAALEPAPRLELEVEVALLQLFRLFETCKVAERLGC